MKWYEFSILVRAESPENALSAVQKSIPFFSKELELPEPNTDSVTIVMGARLIPIEITQPTKH